MTWSDGIEGVHRDIAAEVTVPVHVLAGPGTGKTFAMMRRIARLLESGMPPKHILAVSFTRTAARDLRTQLEGLGTVGAEEVNANTLHSLCFGILAKEAVLTVTGRHARPLMSYEVNQLINDLAYKTSATKTSVQSAIEAYEAAWARQQRDEPGGPPTTVDAAFETNLLDWLVFHRSMLIGELIPVALRFLRQNPALEILPKFEAVLVDEYQDLNKADQRLVQELAAHGELAVIGDDNQSIYSFRHANPEAIRAFRTDFPTAKSFVIEECRRCPPNLVAMSNNLISYNPDARRSPLRPRASVAPAKVVVVQHRSLQDEADAIAAYVDTYLRSNPAVRPGEVLVLSPRRLIGNEVKQALIRRKRNALSYFWEDAVAKDVAAEGLCLLTLAVAPGDRAAYRAWLGIGTDRGNCPGYARVRAKAETDGIEPRAVVEMLAGGSLNLPFTGRIVQRHRLLTARLGSLAGLKGAELVDILWPPGPDTESIRLAAQVLATGDISPGDLLEQLREVITQPELPGSDGDIIRVMSLHKSKGLTAAVVIIVGCSAGAIPTFKEGLSNTEEDAVRREQRRLFYVAMTRATDVLILSSVTELPVAAAKQSGIAFSKVYRRGGELFARIEASPFIAELGPQAPTAVRGSDWRISEGF